MADILNAIKDDVLGSPDPIIQQNNSAVAGELGLPDPYYKPTEAQFVPNPDAMGGVPGAILPNETAPMMPAPGVTVPVAGTSLGIAPQQVQAPQVDPNQYAVTNPGQASAPQATGTAMPKELTGLLGTYDTQQRANKAVANAMAQKSALDEMAQAELEDKLKASELKQQKIQQDFDTAYKAKTADIENLGKQLASQDFTTAKVDSNRLWNNMGTGQKVLAGIAMALSGYGGALSGKGGNAALDLINKAIDRDIEEQKFNIQQDSHNKQLKAQNIRDQMSAQSSLLSNLRAKFGDDLQAESALKSLMIQQTQLKLQQIASSTESKTVQQNAIMLNSQLEREKQMAGMSLKSAIAQQAALQNLGTGGDYESLSPAQKALLPKDVREQFEKQQETSMPRQSGWIGAAPNKELLNKFVEKANEIQPAIDGANRILAATKDLNRVTDIKKRAEIATELKALAGSLRVPFTGPGALTQKEYERLMDTLGDPTSIMSMPTVQRAKLMTVLKKLNNDLESSAANVGLRRRPTVNVPMKPYQ